MPLLRRQIVKMSLAYLRTIAATATLAIILPILAACGGAPETPANPTAALPTAAIAVTQPATTVGQPTTGQAAPTAAAAEPTVGQPASPLETPAVAGQAIKFNNLQFGIVNHLYYTDLERVLKLDEIAGFDWVRPQVVWKDIEGPQPGNYAWGELDKIVDDVAAKNFSLLVNIVQAPSFYNQTNGLPQDTQSLANFVEAMVKRYGRKIAAYEIWNEQNLAHENGGHVTTDDAGHYVDILVECYNRVKAISPATFVLAGAPSSSGVNDPKLAVSDENYYHAMYSYQNGIIKNHFDAQAVHPGG